MPKRLEFFFLFLTTFVKKHKNQIFLGFILGFFSTLFFLQIYPYYKTLNPVKKRIGLVGKYQENNLPLQIRQKISFGLTTLLPSGEATLSLARSVKIEENGLAYLFELPENLRFHDGSKFTAKAVNFRLKDVSFVPLSETKLRLVLKEPYSPILTNLSAPILKPGLIGLGPYKVEKKVYRENYLSEISLLPVKSGLPYLYYKFYPTQDEAILAYKLGKIDILEGISEIRDLAAWKNAQIQEYSLYDRIVTIFLNLKNPFFKEKEVRQALIYAIPPFPQYEKAYTPISPLSFAYSNKIRLYKYDPEIAKKILARSPLASPSIELTLTTYPSLLSTAQIVADAWNQVGVQAKVKVTNEFPFDYQAFLSTFFIPPDPDQYQFWQSTQNTNLTHYVNLKVDKLLEDGRKTYDLETRRKIYADFQKYLVDDAPAIFLYYPKAYTVSKKTKF